MRRRESWKKMPPPLTCMNTYIHSFECIFRSRLCEWGCREFACSAHRLIWSHWKMAFAYKVRGILIQSMARGCFWGFIKSFLRNSTGWWAIIQLQCSQATWKMQEELRRKINRASRNNLVPHYVEAYLISIEPSFVELTDRHCMSTCGRVCESRPTEGCDAAPDWWVKEWDMQKQIGSPKLDLKKERWSPCDDKTCIIPVLSVLYSKIRLHPMAFITSLSHIRSPQFCHKKS